MSIAPLIVKNMVCHRCVLAIEDILQVEKIPFQKVILGEIHLMEKLSRNQEERLKEKLNKIGFEIVDSPTGALIEKIKNLVIKRARNEVDEKESKTKLSHFLSKNVNHEYTYLSSLFSSVEGRTIENYFIEQRIEKVKELLVYDELSLTEISFKLNYSSVAHLSNQFKKVTGLTPSHFKKLKTKRRKTLEDV